MLTISKSTWLTATLGALVMFAAGIIVAASVGTSRAPDPAAAPGQLLDHGGPHCPTSNPNCSITGNRPGNGQDRPPATGGGGGNGICTWNRGDGTITVSLAAQEDEIVEFDCYQPGYGWFDGDHCFWSHEFPALWPPPDEPAEGKTFEEGQWYYGTCVFDIYYSGGTLVIVSDATLRAQWFDFGDAPAITAEQVAQDWLANVALYGVEFDLAPPETGAGLVSLPVWLGVDETENTWGPINDEHCLQGVCVSLVAQVSSVEWSMGDGASFACDRGEHVAWQRGTHDYLRPQGCHHYYERASRNQPDGKYQINATSTWTVDWVGLDDAGQLTTTREATAALQIDEIQVLTR
jgi:hypothetical protein